MEKHITKQTTTPSLSVSEQETHRGRRRVRASYKSIQTRESVCVCVYMYVYTYKERERDRKRCVCVCVVGEKAFLCRIVALPHGCQPPENQLDRMMASESIHYMSNSSTLNSKWKTKTATTTHPLLAVSNSHEQSDTASPNEIDKDEGAVANDRPLEMD